MVEKLPEIVAEQVKAIQNLKIDKITVWDSGHGEKGGSTADFLSSLIGSLPAVHELADQAGIELPGFLGRIASEGESIEEVEVAEPVTQAAIGDAGDGDGEV